ncbi:MAG TPA: ATP-dependent Clp protease proteolytic subunit, partial [candidate division Zixibacteria bacterium]
VATTCVGLAASIAALLLAGGTKGKRSALPHSRMLIHQPWGGVQGQVTDIEIQTKEMRTVREILNDILSKHTGQPVEKIVKDTDRNFFMSPEESKAYGLIDEVFQKKTK